MKLLNVMLLLMLDSVTSVRKKEGPLGMSFKDTTTCKEFGKFARFNPYSVLGGPWKTFYFWTSSRNQLDFHFIVPTKQNITLYKDILSPYMKTGDEIEWANVKLYSPLPHPILLVERNDRGSYYLYDLPVEGHEFTLEPLEVVFKQKEKYIGFMICGFNDGFALARKNDMPRRDQVQEAASKIGFRSRGGKSYLYQGNDWMPVGDAHEEDVYGPGMKFL